jgi:hypothetical protein
MTIAKAILPSHSNAPTHLGLIVDPISCRNYIHAADEIKRLISPVRESG